MAADVEITHKPTSAPTRTKPGDVNVRLSRYRSVRKAQLKQHEDAVPEDVPPPPPLPAEAGQLHQNIQRSMSRYHRRAPPSRQKAAPVPPVPVAEPVKKSVPYENGIHNDSQSSAVGVPLPYPDYPSDSRRPREPSAAKPNESEPHATRLDQQTRWRPQTAGKSEGEWVLANERMRHEKIKEQQRAERAERDKALEAERRKREQEEEELRRVEREKAAEEERIQRAREEEREREAREKAEAKQKAKEEKLARKRRPTDIRVPSQEPPDPRVSSSRGSTNSPMSSRRTAVLFRRKKEDETPRTSTTTEERRPKTGHASPPKWGFPTIKPGGGGIVPLSDAPVSGVAGAERRVRVRFGKSEITLPAEPTTSALQLIRSASNVISEQFNPRAAVIYEHYKSQGVRRPLRMYEHVRSVMNSWEDDNQNYLVIEQSDPDSDEELYARFAQQQEPSQLERWLMYQYKPGKWDDRWITLRSDGQITAAKNQTGKDMVTLCHLSDFDIYKPIPETKKRRKPSKKILLSIKSQQKSAMFLDKTNFIHHFYTDNKATADEFFRAVQYWRSYYLANTMGQGPANKGEQTTGTNGHTRSKSAESHYLLGSFNTLGLDFSNFAKPPEPEAPPKSRNSFDENRPLGTFGMTLPSAQEHSRVVHQRQLSQRKERSRLPPTSMRHGIPNQPGGREDALRALNGNARQSWDSNRSGDGAFNPNGLLGSGYDQRRHATKPSQDCGGGLQRNTSVRSTRSQRRSSFDSATLGRGNSVRRPDFGKPLLDFTPQYKEPPQFAKRGKGYKPDHIGTGGLINSATSPENAIFLPGNEDWRARPKTSGGVLDRSKSITRSKSTRRQPNGMPPEDNEAFTGGLLASSGHGWGSGNTGHGVMSGNHARGPMLNLNEPSMFGNGSLLRKIEANHLGNPIAREPWRVD